MFDKVAQPWGTGLNEPGLWQLGMDEINLQVAMSSQLAAPVSSIKTLWPVRLDLSKFPAMPHTQGMVLHTILVFMIAACQY